jgi:Alr-MurF fusion protein
MSILKEPIETSAKILLTDSRFLSDSTTSLFFAIKGARHDGHTFIKDLYKKGIREFVVEKEAFEAQPELQSLGEKEDIKIWVVKNGITALQNLAKKKRLRFHYPVVGITGSNGKTIVKEWLSQLLEGDFEIIKSPRSYNSQIGVALSVWEMTKNHTLGIFEAGISMQNEMEQLETIIQPEIGIFTNIGPAHNEGFRSLKQKILEKLRLFKNSKTLVYCLDYQEINEEINILLKAVNPGIKLIAWSKNKKGDYPVRVEQKNGNSQIGLTWANKTYHFEIPFTDAAAIENAIHCGYASLQILDRFKEEKNYESFFEKFKLLKPVAMRLELKQGTHDNYIIDDTYNNDLGGLKMAFHFMSQHHTKRSKALIISDILQTGLPEADLYQNLAELIKSQHIHTLVGIGPKISMHKALFSECSAQTPTFFESTHHFLKQYPFEQLMHALVLVKGARPFAFEKIVNQLIMKVHGTVFEINLDALTHNLNFYRNKIGTSTKIMVMVKAFAYGSGSTEVASWLQYHRVNYLAVAYPDEGVTLRKDGIKLPIMVLNSDPNTFHKVFEYDLEPEIYSLRLLKAYMLLKKNAAIKQTTKIHLKIDTGMHRLGFEKADIEEMTQLLKTQDHIEVASIFSHLVGADEAEHVPFSKDQILKFTDISHTIIEKIGYSPLRHICNSAGIVRFPEAKFDMVRLGIGLYGVEAAGIEPEALQVVGTLKTTISQIKTLQKGDTVGYGRHGKVEKETKIATLAIGYADGYDRGFGRGVGQVFVNGILCPTFGNVCMDMTMIDVSQAPCKEGDQVVIFGENPSIVNLAEKIQTIPYEILTGVSERVKRVFFHE